MSSRWSICFSKTNMPLHVYNTQPRWYYYLMHRKDLGKWQAGSVMLSLSFVWENKTEEKPQQTFGLSFSPSSANHQPLWPIEATSMVQIPPIKWWNSSLLWSTTHRRLMDPPDVLGYPAHVTWFYGKWALLHLYNTPKGEACILNEFCETVTCAKRGKKRTPCKQKTC